MNYRSIKTSGIILLHAWLLLALLAVPVAAAGVQPANAAPTATTRVVTNLNNTGAGSLRDAIFYAEPGDTIVFADGLSGELALTTNPLFIYKNLSILGPGSDRVTLSGLNQRQIFRITRTLDDKPTRVLIAGLALRGGQGYDGGAIHNETSLEIRNTTVYSNTANIGGGIHTTGALTLTNVTLSGNHSIGDGGGLYFDNGVTVTTTLALNQTTISGNSAAGLGGGLFTEQPAAGGKIILFSRTVIAGNHDGANLAPDCYTAAGAQALSSGYNLIGALDSCGLAPASGDQTGTAANPLDPRLAPLAASPHLTHTPLPGSPLLDAAGAGCTAADQRGFPRPMDGNGDQLNACDIGAHERIAARPALSITAPPALLEGAAGGVNAGLLSAVDAETGADQLLYTLLAPPARGALLLGDQSLQAGETFSQTALALGSLTFVHDGSEENTAGFDFVVSDDPAPRTTQDSWRQDGAGPNGSSTHPAISAEGRFIAYQSEAADIVPMDQNGVADVFLYDRQIQTTQRVSVDYAETEGNGPSSEPVVSADGRYVFFTSLADNLDSDDANHTYDIFRHDTLLDQTQMVSLNDLGFQGDGPSISPTISADGRYVAFLSTAANLVADDTNEVADVFVADIHTGKTKRVSVSSSGLQSAAPASGHPAISADGRFVAFAAAGDDLTPGDSNGAVDVFVHDRWANSTMRVSLGAGAVQADGPSWEPAISADGRAIAFISSASNLVPGDTNGQADVFVFDRIAQTTTRVSVASSGAQANGPSYSPVISADGQRVVFGSRAANLVAGDDNTFCDLNNDGDPGENCPDIFMHDRTTGATWRVSVAGDGSPANAASWAPALALNGSQVAFASRADNLAAGGANAFCGPGGTVECADIFSHDSGAPFGTLTFDILPVNDIPNVSASSDPPSAAEGSLITFSGSFSDPDLAGAAQITWTFGDGASTQGTLNPTHTYLDDGVFEVLLQVDDGDGGVGGGMIFQEVVNVAPLVDAGPDIRVPPETQIVIRGAFTDPGINDTWTATIDFGDGSGPRPLSLAANGSFELAYLYATEGLFRVKVQVLDDDGGLGEDMVMVQAGNVYMYLPAIRR